MEGGVYCIAEQGRKSIFESSRCLPCWLEEFLYNARRVQLHKTVFSEQPNVNSLQS